MPKTKSKIKKSLAQMSSSPEDADQYAAFGQSMDMHLAATKYVQDKIKGANKKAGKVSTTKSKQSQKTTYQSSEDSSHQETTEENSKLKDPIPRKNRQKRKNNSSPDPGTFSLFLCKDISFFSQFLLACTLVLF